MSQEGQVPKYSQLQMSEEQYQNSTLKDADNLNIKEFLILCNSPVPNTWVKKVKVGGGRTINYIPIDKIEYLLTRMFGVYWRREILREQLILNTVISTVRLHYKIPGTNIWCFQDGAGGSPIQVDALEDPNNPNSRKIKASELQYLKSTAIQQAFPSSASFALSNAAERLGVLFGKDLNKPDGEVYDGYYNPNDGIESAETVYSNQNTRVSSYNGDNGVSVQMPNSNGNSNTAVVTTPIEIPKEEPKQTTKPATQFQMKF